MRDVREEQNCKLADATTYEWELISMFLEVVQGEGIDPMEESVVWHQVASIGHTVINAIEAEQLEDLED